MKPELWHRAKEIYNSALERQPEQREAFIAEACAGDVALRKEVESLLGWQQKAGNFIESPALDVAGKAMAAHLTAEASIDLTGRRLLHYTIREKLGAGGMGVVYRALDAHLDRTVAIKVLPAAAVADQERKRRFQAMSDLKAELDELKEAAESGRLHAAPAAVTRVSRGRLVVAAVAVIVLVATGWCWLGRRRTAEPEAVLTPVPLTSYPGAESTPSFSPDGTQVAFKWCTEGPSENCRYPAVARHGNRLAYEVWRDDSNIWRVDLGKPDLNPGTLLPLISSTRVDACPAYSPDGTRIAFFSNRSGAYELWVCNSDGSNPAQLTSCGGVDNGPRWSPDGRTITFTVFDGRYQHIYLISANGGIPRRLTNDPTIHDKWPYWSRDGQSIYFDSWRDGKNQIWKVPAAGGKAVQITPNGEIRVMAQESPDGKFLYYRKPEKAGSPHRSVWRMPVGGGEETMVLGPISGPGGYRVREQGIYFFTPAGEQGHSAICLYEFATGKTRRILTVERPISFYIEVSPDGRSILYTQLDQAGSDLMLVENFR